MIEIVTYRKEWPDEFKLLGAQLRKELGGRALAIHHIGSTAVPGLVAKDVIDAQITVASLDESILTDLLAAGFTKVRATKDHCPPGMTLPDEDLAKLMINGSGRRSHIHIRVEGRFNQRYPLLCRDYLRTHQSVADAYGRVKQELAKYFPDNVDAYYDIKDPVFDVLMSGARDWETITDWTPPQTDA